MSEAEIMNPTPATSAPAVNNSSETETTLPPEIPDQTAGEARWRNYQRLIWTQQQIHRQIQQQSMTMKHAVGDGANNEVGTSNSDSSQRYTSEVAEKQGDTKTKAGPESSENSDPQSAFLGPILWDKRIAYDGSDFKLEYVDLEEFLTENGIPFDPSLEASFALWKPVDHPDYASGNPVTSTGPPPSLFLSSQFLPGPPRGPVQIHNVTHTRDSSSQEVPQSRSPSPCSSSSQCMSQEGTPAVSPDSTQLTELHPAVIPGHEFDPRLRAFTDDELKPQPMIKKSKKQFIPDEQKDTRYWARRRKNNLAAKRSRDARRLKENQIALRACFLEKENNTLKLELERMQTENSLLKEQLGHYH
jgi:leukemia factor-related protein